MDPRVLDYYSRELLYLRELAAEFAQVHPKIARRLGMHAGEIADPYVERLIESFCFMAARMQMRIDEAFPLLSQALLETVYPNYVRPTPSIAVARLHPGHESGHLGKGFLIPRGTAFVSRTPIGEGTACEFRSSQDVRLYPLKVAQARLTGVPPDIASLDRYMPSGLPVHGALRLRLRTTNGTSIASLDGLDRLPIYLAGDECSASHLFELILFAGVTTIAAAPGRFSDGPLHAVTHEAVVHEGLEPGQSVLPAVPLNLHGHNLVQEYFACPARFWFFTLTGLEKGLARITGNEVEIVVLLSRPPGALAETVDASHFALFCTPVVNLFPMRTKRLELQLDRVAHLLVPVAAAPADFELHSIDVAYGHVEEGGAELRFEPRYKALTEDESDSGHYFTLQRQLCKPADGRRHHGTRRPFTATQTFLSLVDGEGRPHGGGIRHLSLDAWLSNRELPCLIVHDGVDDLRMINSIPVAGIGLVRAPSAPRPPLAQGDMAWLLAGQLSMDYRAFDDPLSETPPGEGLRRRLRLFVTPDAGAQRQQVESLVRAKARTVNRMLRAREPVVFGRGIECELTFDESGFGGLSPYTLALVLEHYVARHVSTHSFTATVLRSQQRGRIAAWPPRAGTRGMA
ncbi:type VI secretion system baseplate subunit TssF [Paraburkholderia phenoliruptrix]|uniref:type VI secretion system baseplate subunit TssF n=1 Tax=Paraburkholderia phenoliruptrix TaxID=252970 RepID=UPI002869E27E|nr:type VI secretion system baseplate subunit TssF [Paraburkholderia phenoliruptrix]WMY08885.1 type VI secretion system baseplate subunit TssF [Paraburkholderia phenoliruptrix]